MRSPRTGALDDQILGTPAKHQQEREKRESLIFLGLKPWAVRGEMDDITDRMIAEKAAEDKLKALEAKKPVVIDVDKNDSEVVPEGLELVEPPPESPESFGGERR